MPAVKIRNYHDIADGRDDEILALTWPVVGPGFVIWASESNPEIGEYWLWGYEGRKDPVPTYCPLGKPGDVIEIQDHESECPVLSARITRTLLTGLVGKVSGIENPFIWKVTVEAA